MFRATRPTAESRQIITILQPVLSSERPINYQGTRGKCRCRRIAPRLKGRREPGRRVRRMPEPNSRDRRSRGSRLVRFFRPQYRGEVSRALTGTGRVEDDPRLSRLYNRFYLQGDRSATYAERAGDPKLARLQ